MELEKRNSPVRKQRNVGSVRSSTKCHREAGKGDTRRIVIRSTGVILEDPKVCPEASTLHLFGGGWGDCVAENNRMQTVSRSGGCDWEGLKSLGKEWGVRIHQKAAHAS